MDNLPPEDRSNPAPRPTAPRRVSYDPWSMLTNYLIAINVAVYVAMGSLGGGWVSADNLLIQARYGADNAAQTANGEWWRLVTAMFLHYGILHLALNMWALFQAGTLLERLQGKRVFLLIYFGSGLVANLTSLCWHGDRLWSAGASGAIFGIIGAIIGSLVREKHALPRTVYQPLLKSMLSFVGYNLVFGAVVSNIDNADHVGGLVGGFALGWVSAMPAGSWVGSRAALGRFWQAVGLLVVAVSVGVAVAPRYDYLPLEEADLQAVNVAHGKGEDAIIHAQTAYFQNFQEHTPNRELAGWLAGTAIPFYEKWASDLSSLPLQPGFKSARQRDQLVKIFGLRATYLRHLAAVVPNGTEADLSRFDPEARQIEQANADYATIAK